MKGCLTPIDFGARGDGITDDQPAIQAALDSGARHVVIPAGNYLLRNVLIPHEGQCVEIHGTLGVADAVIRPLLKDVKPGDCKVRVKDAGAFAAGQWVCLADDNLPQQNEKLGLRRSNAGTARILRMEGDVITLDLASAREYRTSAGAVMATNHSAVLIRHSGVRICGTGVIDANRGGQLNVAPGFLDSEQSSTDHRAASGIAVSAYPGWVEDVIIEGITVQNATLLNIGMKDARRSVIRNTVCRGAHDKNIALERVEECRVLNNRAEDSVFEDGICFHQKSDPDRGSTHVVVSGNVCSGNPRCGITIGSGMRHFQLSNNHCLNNGTNLVIRGEHVTSHGGSAIGGNDKVYPFAGERPNVYLAGRHLSINGLTALGTPSAAVGIGGSDITISGGAFGDLHLGCDGNSGVGFDFAPLSMSSYQPLRNPTRITIRGATVRGCRQVLRICPGAKDLRFENNSFDANETLGEFPSEMLTGLHWLNNTGMHPTGERDAPGFHPRIFLVGDSTMAAWPVPGPKSPQAGWGQFLPEFCDPETFVFNHATGGCSSRSYRSEGRWQQVLESLCPRDFVFIQFGHNDEKKEDPLRCSDPASDFPMILADYVNSAKAAGAEPILLTPVCRRPSGKAVDEDRLADYAQAVRRLASEQEVAIIDLHRISRERIAKAGPELSKTWFFHLAPGAHFRHSDGCADDTHFHERGARLVAAWIVEDAITKNLPVARHLIQTHARWLETGTAGNLH